MTNELENYADSYEDEIKRKPRLRSLISRGSKPVRKEIWDETTGMWRSVVRMSRDKFDDQAKEVFLKEYAEWGRMGEAASAAGVTPATVRRHMEDDEDFAEAVMVQEEEYQDRLIRHHQNLIFEGIEKNRYDREGNLVETSREYPIRLIELELKKHDEGYRDKQEVKVNHTGGVLVAPAEMGSIDDWESRFNNATDVTPEPPLLGSDAEEAD